MRQDGWRRFGAGLECGDETGYQTLVSGADNREQLQERHAARARRIEQRHLARDPVRLRGQSGSACGRRRRAAQRATDKSKQAGRCSPATKANLDDLGLEWHDLADVDALKARFPAVAGRPIGASDGKSTRITAVRTIDGGRITGDKFILATGARTANLIPAWNSMVATAPIVGFVRLTPAEMQALKDLPIIFSLSTGFFSFPPHEKSGYLKVACHSFGYTLSSAASCAGELHPAGEDGQVTCWVEGDPAGVAARGFEKTWLCWYNETPTGDSSSITIRNADNLVLSSAFKFLPVIGKYSYRRAFQRRRSEVPHRVPRSCARGPVPEWRRWQSRRAGRREFTNEDRDRLLSLTDALSTRQSRM
ncbi:hypothetical protein BDW62DRAFT_204534 [Aspergillus aurantiobrunneus]